SQAKTVAQAVAKIVAVAGLVDHVAGQPVYFGPGVTGPARLQGGLLRGQDRVPDSQVAVAGRLAQAEGAGQVGAVAVDNAAKIQGDWFPRLDTPAGRVGVGHSRIGAGSNDRFK